MPDISWPPILTAPSEGSKNPEIVRSNVVLPQPEGPRIEKNSPPLISSVTFFTAVKPPKRIVTWSRSTSALMPQPFRCPAPASQEQGQKPSGGWGRGYFELQPRSS